MKITLTATLTPTETSSLDTYISLANGLAPGEKEPDMVRKLLGRYAAVDTDANTVLSYTMDIPEKQVTSYLGLCSLFLPKIVDLLNVANSPEAMALIHDFNTAR